MQSAWCCCHCALEVVKCGTAALFTSPLSPLPNASDHHAISPKVQFSHSLEPATERLAAAAGPYVPILSPDPVSLFLPLPHAVTGAWWARGLGKHSGADYRVNVTQKSTQLTTDGLDCQAMSQLPGSRIVSRKYTNNGLTEQVGRGMPNNSLCSRRCRSFLPAA